VVHKAVNSSKEMQTLLLFLWIQLVRSIMPGVDSRQVVSELAGGVDVHGNNPST